MLNTESCKVRVNLHPVRRCSWVSEEAEHKGHIEGPKYPMRYTTSKVGSFPHTARHTAVLRNWGMKGARARGPKPNRAEKVAKDHKIFER